MSALDKKLGVQLFQFIKHLHEEALFIVTTNKSPQEGVIMLGDEIITTALQDRILFLCFSFLVGCHELPASKHPLQ
jgi:hypothetical protein